MYSYTVVERLRFVSWSLINRYYYYLFIYLFIHLLIHSYIEVNWSCVSVFFLFTGLDSKENRRPGVDWCSCWFCSLFTWSHAELCTLIFKTSTLYCSSECQYFLSCWLITHISVIAIQCCQTMVAYHSSMIASWCCSLDCKCIANSWQLCCALKKWFQFFTSTVNWSVNQHSLTCCHP